MNDMPDYSKFHAHELRNRFKVLDPKNDQEEMQEIQKWLDKGGYQFPASNTVTNNSGGYSVRRKDVRVRFHNKNYILVLFVLLASLLLWNLYALIFLNLTMALIPIVFQSIIIYCLYKAHPKSRLLVKIWAALMMVSGFFGVVAILVRGILIFDSLLFNILYLVLGAYVWKKANQLMEIVYAEIDDEG